MFQVRDVSEVREMLLSGAGVVTWGLVASFAEFDCTVGELEYCRKGGDDDTKAPTEVGLSGLISLTDGLVLLLPLLKMSEQKCSSLDVREYLSLVLEQMLQLMH